MALLTNLVAFYKFESGNLTIDSMANARPLTNNGTVAESASGKFGYCADYGTANTTKYFNRADNLGIDGGSITISTWIKLNTEIGAGSYSIALQGSVTSQVNYVMVYEYNAGTRRFGVNRQKQNVTNNTSYGTTTLGTSSWHHCALRYDGTNLSGWLDGVKVCADLATSGNGASAATSNISFGFDNQFTGAYASMLQDSTGIWSRALSDAEIVRLSGSKDFPFMEAISDGFDAGSTDTAMWTVTGSVSQASSMSTHTGANGDCGISTGLVYLFMPGATLETYGNLTRTTASGHWLGFQSVAGSGLAAFYVGWNFNANIHINHGGDSANDSDFDTGVAAGTTAAKHKFKLVWRTDYKVEYWIDDVLKYTSTNNLTGRVYPARIRLGQVYDSGHVQQFDYMTLTIGGVVTTIFGQGPRRTSINNSAFN